MRNFVTALLITLALSTTYASAIEVCSTDYRGRVVCTDDGR